MNRRTFLLGALGVIGAAVGGGVSFVKRPEFGRLPSGDRLMRIQKSPHYANGHFQNLVPVPIMNDDPGQPHENRVVASIKWLLEDKSALIPKRPLPSAKTDIAALKDDAVVWLGHSSFFIRLNDKNILVDPVFSAYASPLFFINKAFPGSNIYTAADFPRIDILTITHDHWDHLDYKSVMGLKDKTQAVICPLGVGEYLEQWGFAADKIFEEDWYEQIDIADNLTVHILPTQHFSGRFLTQNPTEWGGFAFVTNKRKVYVSGDGGYGTHFKAIGEKFGGFDLALMENGQYNMAWHAIHMLPVETADAAADVKARYVIPSHSGKFALSRHPWQEPYRELTKASTDMPYKLLTPKIGEAVYIDQLGTQSFSPWWEEGE